MKQTRKSGGAFIGKGVHGDVFNAGKTRKLPPLFSLHPMLMLKYMIRPILLVKSVDSQTKLQK